MATAERFVTRSEFEAMKAQLAELTEQMAEVRARLGEVEQRLDKVEQRLDKVEQRLDKVEQRLDRVETRLDELIARFDAFEGYVEDGFEAQRRLIEERHAQVMRAISDGNNAVLSAVMQLLRRAE